MKGTYKITEDSGEPLSPFAPSALRATEEEWWKEEEELRTFSRFCQFLPSTLRGAGEKPPYVVFYPLDIPILMCYVPPFALGRGARPVEPRDPGAQRDYDSPQFRD